MSTFCSKHVEAWNKYIEKSASSWSLTRIHLRRPKILLFHFFSKFPVYWSSSDSSNWLSLETVGIIVSANKPHACTQTGCRAWFCCWLIEWLVMGRWKYYELHFRPLCRIPRIGSWNSVVGRSCTTAFITNNMFNVQLYSNADVITSLLACYVL